MNIVFLEPKWTAMFIVAVICLCVTVFWDNIKVAFTKNNDEIQTAWGKLKHFFTHSLWINIVRYAISIAILACCIYVLAIVDDMVCITVVVLICIGVAICIPMFLAAAENSGEKQAVILFSMMIAQFIIVITVFMCGGGVKGFYILGTMVLNFIILPKSQWLKNL